MFLYSLWLYALRSLPRQSLIVATGAATHFQDRLNKWAVPITSVSMINFATLVLFFFFVFSLICVCEFCQTAC